MHIISKDREELKQLEESLWVSKTRFDFSYMNRILADDFFEFGRSGRIYQRSDTLSIQSQNIKAKLPLKNFMIHPIGQDIVLITYISEVKYEQIELGNRSSIWSKINGKWQLRFHQGTPC